MWNFNSSVFIPVGVTVLAQSVELPNFQKDETMHRETLENLGCSLSAERHMRMVLAMDRLVAANGHLLRGCDGHLSYA